MEHIKGPDFPTGGIIMGRSGIRAAYATGRGKITLRGRATIEEKERPHPDHHYRDPLYGQQGPPDGNMADLVKDKRIEGITDLNDVQPQGHEIVVEIRKDANPQVVLNQLYRYTQLQDTVGVIMLALDDGVPKIISLKTMMQRYLDFQFQVIRRRTAYELKKAQDREHILEGLRKAVDIVDEIIATIRACKGGFAEAKAAIMERFGFDDPQADAIVKLQLGRLAGLEILKIDEELGQLRASIENYKDILSNDAHTMEIVKTDLTALADKYGDDRRTSIEAVSGEVDIEDLIPEETCVFTLTHEGYIKRTAVDTYSAQNRGGRGVAGMTQKDNDFTEELFVGSTHDYMLFMTDKGRVYRLKGYPGSRGQPHRQGDTTLPTSCSCRRARKLHHDAPARQHGRGCQLHHDGNAAGPDQAHAAFPVPQHPQGRPERHCAERGRCPCLVPPDRRRGRADRGQLMMVPPSISARLERALWAAQKRWCARHQAA